MSSKKTCAPRCAGKLNSGAPCLRKRQKDVFCNHHFKASQNIVLKLVEVNGILRFVGENDAVYSTVEILDKNPNPTVVGYCKKTGETYSFDFLDC